MIKLIHDSLYYFGTNTSSFDRGDVLATASYAIHPDALRAEVTEDLASLGAKLMVDVVKACRSTFDSYGLLFKCS